MHSFLVAGLASLAIILVIGIGAAFTIYQSYADDLVPPEELLANESSGGAAIYDRNGNLLYQFMDPLGGLRDPVPLDRISPWLVKATVSTEDASFYSNPGINIKGLLRAAYENFFPGTGPGFLQGSGGSSITQQLVKNVYIPREERAKRSVSRKIKETVLAIELNRRYSKDQILEWYLNQIYYGNLAYGAEAAAQRYFGKSASDLTVGQAALLAGIPSAPAYYDPIENAEIAKERQHEVLDLMVKHGFLDEVTAGWAKMEPMEYVQQKFEIRAPHFVFYVRDTFLKMCEKGIIPKVKNKDCQGTFYRSGLKITTSLNLDLQNKAEEIVEQWVSRYEAETNGHNAALVSIDPKTGQIIVMVGSRDYFREDIHGQNNMATAENSPGSSIKPFTYLTAFLRGWTPATLIPDTPITIGNFSPQNHDLKFHGPVSVRTALGNSLNVPAVKTIMWAGVDNVIDTAHKMGITTLNQKNYYGPALTLGGGDVNLLDMTFAYAVFANNGVMKGMPTVLDLPDGHRKLDPVAILKVQDNEGKTIYEYTKPQEQAIVPANYTYLITSILSDDNARLITFGAGSSLNLPGRQAAAKTGTAECPLNKNAICDTWTMGYTPDLVTGVWVGNSDNAEMYRIFSSVSPARIWHDFMVAAHADIPPKPFVRPPGVVEATVCWPSGLLPTDACGKTFKEVFAEGAVPTQRDNLWRKVKIDKRCGLLAADDTPASLVEEKVFLVLPDELAEWAEANGYPAPPKEKCNIEGSRVFIRQPAFGTVVQRPVVVLGRANSPGFVSYHLEYGAGQIPSDWKTITPPQRSPVEDGPLGTFDPTGLRPGVYTIRLVVTDRQMGDLYAFVTIQVAQGPHPTATPTPKPTFTPIPRPTPPPGATPTPSPTPTPTVDFQYNR